MTTRKEHMKINADQARRYDETGDVVLRTQAADGWLYYATASEIARAPKYLTWTGRK